MKYEIRNTKYGLLCDHTFGAGLNLACPPFWGLNSDDFPFFTSSLSSLEPELAPLEKSQEICIISEIALKVELAPIDFSLISYWFQKAKWSAHRKNSPWTWPANGQTHLVLLRNDQNKIINQQNRNIISTISIFAKTRFFLRHPVCFLESYQARLTESKQPHHVGKPREASGESSQELRNLGRTQDCVDASTGIAQGSGLVHSSYKRLERRQSASPPCRHCSHQGEVWVPRIRSRGTRPLHWRFSAVGSPHIEDSRSVAG